MTFIKGFNPMPDGVEIRKSRIHGYGLFATENIRANHNLGITHVKDERFPDGYVRTALGSYANHSEVPNIKDIKKDDLYSFLTIREIAKDEELFVDYRDFNYDENVLRGYGS